MRIGIDLGGTKIEGVALGDDGRARAGRRVAAPRGDYDRTIRAIVDLVAALEQSAGERGRVGVGIPGAISPATGLVKNANSTWLIGHPMADDLSRALDRPVRLANDANCFALSEATDGAAAGAAVVFGVIIGTGTGGGLVVHGRVVVGANAIAGEWGHNPLPPRRGCRAGDPGLPAPRDDERPGPQCYCGRSGCIETFLSGPALSRDYSGGLRGGSQDPPRQDRERRGGSLDPPVDAAEIVARAAAGEPAAAACLARYEERLARALGSVINVIDPDVIVLGGGLSNVDRLYTTVPALWPPFVFSDRVGTRLVKAAHGDASGVRGAAWLWEL
ncbi:MAG: ROK family protein [Acidobacteriota bacterium]|nr:ROK family protein [Acidobacteriota bacterium]